MKRELLDLIVCPDCGSEFDLRDATPADGEVADGQLACRGESHTYAIRDGVPRFVHGDAYADAFALEWNAFRTDHLDSFTGLTYLDDQLREYLDFPLEKVEGKLVLDAG